MKTASVRDLRQNFPRVLAWLQAGEEVAITMRRQAIARLVPWPKRNRMKRPMPDISARLSRVFGQTVIADQAMNEVLEHNRGRI